MTAGAVSAPLIIPLQTHRAKNHVDINTPVSIQSDTPGVLIIYTLDGSKPVAVQRGSTCSSRKYSGPILLPAGRVSVRAVAVSSDGRESSTVSKVFSVHAVDSKDMNDQQHPSEELFCSPETSASSSLRPAERRTATNSRREPNTAAQSGAHRPASAGALRQMSSTDASRIRRETGFMRCAQCFSSRPLDPFARFCAKCGAAIPALPEQRPPPAEGGQMVRCALCQSLVPVNTKACLICEASIHQQLQPQAARSLQGHMLCVCCGSANPAHVSSCVTCETHLHMVGGLGNSTPPVPSADSRTVSCSRCKRVNHGDARFCDWCGSKLAGAARCVLCWRCGASGNPYAFYCTACGVYLEAPTPPTAHSDASQPVGLSAPSQVLLLSFLPQLPTPSSDPTPNVKVSPPTEHRSTQTVGLYFPSATELHRKQQQRQLQLSRDQATRDRQPPLTAISPGRGYWRKQLDHVCAHLRSYTQNNAPFRTLLGEPRLGRMLFAVIQEDQYEVSLTISFVSAGERERKQVGPEYEAADPAAGVWGTETLSSVTEKCDDSNVRNDQSTRPMKPLKPNLTPSSLVKDAQLLKELGPGRGQISVIQQLLDQGADPSCCNSDGRHALVVAVGNGHHDVLPVLVQRGADVDQQSGQMKNTALHEAAALGSEGLECARVLLSCRARARQRNVAGQTPYDVAVTSGCNHMASLLAAQAGLDLLGKPKLNLDIF